ncbi:MAG: tRNA glutamyl-Q(34) synthetase GluQRS [Planctomycetes bacterium]|nr:tRNA glutamyl-Q(34) synthetase GluQRS [Planctomycetota bacterium]
MTAHQRTTRLAPSPTGALHLGNARTFLINWALARRNGWRIVLRIEDLDGPRVKPGADTQAIEDLAWLGLDWDLGPVYQRADLTPYREALDALSRKRLIYPCTCTRKELEAAQSAPHGDEHDLRYPGTCRGKTAVTADSAWRVIVPDETISFSDMIAGDYAENVQATVGDFVVATKAGLPAYQLAVVVDDARRGVTDVVRGDDLLSSAARQLWLYRMLDLTPPPRYWHLPLVLGTDGRRLAKRHGDSRVATYRAQGVTPERIIGLIAAWSGLCEWPTPMSAREFAAAFDAEKLPRTPATFRQEDHAWLHAGSH